MTASLELNGSAVPWVAGQTLAHLLAEHGLTEGPLAVVVDGDFVPRSAHAVTVLPPGARVSTFAPITGG